MEDNTIEIEPVVAPEISQPSDEPRPATYSAPKRKALAKRRSKKRRGVKAVGGTKTTREKGGISFVYHDLDTAIGIARAMLDAGGVALTRDQLAGITNLTATGGTFIMRTAAARQFGLISYTQSRFEITSLGFEILGPDDGMRRAARARAFLSVPLFARTYEEFKGKQLPPRPHGLEAAFVRFGVPDKQRANARISFDKSAKQAGFFDNGMDRLVEPIIVGGGGSGDRGRLPPEVTDSEPSGGGGRIPPKAQVDERSLHPFIQGLLDTLPTPDTVWTIEGRGKWLQTAANIFDLIYMGDGTISITIQRPSGEKTES